MINRRIQNVTNPVTSLSNVRLTQRRFQEMCLVVADALAMVFGTTLPCNNNATNVQSELTHQSIQQIQTPLVAIVVNQDSKITRNAQKSVPFLLLVLEMQILWLSHPMESPACARARISGTLVIVHNVPLTSTKLTTATVVLPV